MIVAVTCLQEEALGFLSFSWWPVCPPSVGTGHPRSYTRGFLYSGAELGCIYALSASKASLPRMSFPVLGVFSSLFSSLWSHLTSSTGRHLSPCGGVGCDAWTPQVIMNYSPVFGWIVLRRCVFSTLLLIRYLSPGTSSDSVTFLNERHCTNSLWRVHVRSRPLLATAREFVAARMTHLKRKRGIAVHRGRWMFGKGKYDDDHEAANNEHDSEPLPSPG